jgi:cytoskeletal protein CcmA (bactofilin family)
MSAPSTASFQSPVANATIGPNVVIKGEIISREDLTIQGEVEGTIEIGDNRLTIALDGKVCADVTARELEVRGSMEGTIRASEKVYVRNSANVVGDIYAASIIVEDGAYIKGGIDLTKPVATSRSNRPGPIAVRSEADADQAA